MDIEPAPGKVIIKRFMEDAPEGTEFGTAAGGKSEKIIIPDSVRKFSNKGVIVAMGLETESRKNIWKKGDIVIFPANPTVLPIEDGKSFVMCNQYDIVLRFTGEQKVYTEVVDNAQFK